MKYSFKYSTAVSKPTADQLFAQAQALAQQNQLASAASRCEQALLADPGHLNSLQFLGELSAKLRAFDRAEQCFAKVNERRPDFAPTYRHRGLALASLNKYDEALACFDKALEIEPNHVGGKFNRAVALQSLLRLDSAIAAYQAILTSDPSHESARWNLGICQLLRGNLPAGFALFENRWLNESFRQHQGSRRFQQPKWLGQQDLAGKTLFVHAEQGLGDTIQFVRYAKLLAHRGAKVICEVQPPLLELLKACDPSVEFIARGEPIPAHDFHSPLLSLPLACRTDLASIPAEPFYLRPPSEKLQAWAERFSAFSGLKVGLVWQGSTTHAADAQRSLSLAMLLDSLPTGLRGGISYFSLQKELSDADMATLSMHPELQAIGGDFLDFTDTAAACAALDLVISVDTSVAHLSAALGKPLWLMLANEPDWRWLLGRSDSPWYPSARLFRQPLPGDWVKVLTQVSTELMNLKTAKGLL